MKVYDSAVRSNTYVVKIICLTISDIALKFSIPSIYLITFNLFDYSDGTIQP